MKLLNLLKRSSNKNITTSELEQYKAKYDFFARMCENLPEYKQIEILANVKECEKQAEYKANNKFTDEINQIDPYMHYNEYISFMLHYGFDWNDINYYKDNLEELKQIMNNYTITEDDKKEMVKNTYINLYI